MKRIHMISGPRNLSTALMYSFGNRQDTQVIDEPFYGCYLTNNKTEHPGVEEIMASMDTIPANILEKQIFAYYQKPILFIKNMAHHWINLDYSILVELDNVFLIRDLKKLILSFSKVVNNPKLQDIGLKQEFEMYKYLEERGKRPFIVNSDTLLQDPKAMIIKLCSVLEIPFVEPMLKWDAGPRKEDGVWAKYWYKNVHQSTGFKQTVSSSVELPDHLIPLYNEALPLYEYLEARTI